MVGVKLRSRVILQVRMRAIHQRNPTDHHRHFAALGLGPACLGTRWAADVAERTGDTWPRLLYAPRRIYLGDRPGEPDLTGRTGGHPGLNNPYSTGPTSCLARTRSTGSHRGLDRSGRRGCPAPAVSPAQLVARKDQFGDAVLVVSGDA